MTSYRSVVLLFLLVLFAGCRERIVNFIFDHSKASSLETYTYKYMDGKKISETHTYKMLISGYEADASVFTLFYDYDDRGMLVRERNYLGDEELEVHTYIYDNRDSLIAEYRISAEGDTLQQIEYGYFPDGRQITCYIYYLLNFLSDFDPASDKEVDPEKAAEELRYRTYDTLYHRYEYLYEGNKCQSRVDYNRYNQPGSITGFEYEKDLLVKATTYAVTDSRKTPVETVFYSYSKSATRPDYYSIGTANDTISKCVHQFDGTELMTATETSGHGNYVVTTFYRDGKEIGRYEINKQLNKQSREAYTYDKNGELEKIKRYSEGLE